MMTMQDVLKIAWEHYDNSMIPCAFEDLFEKNGELKDRDELNSLIGDSLLVFILGELRECVGGSTDTELLESASSTMDSIFKDVEAVRNGFDTAIEEIE